MRHTLLGIILVLVTLLAVLHGAANALSLYFHLWWYDIGMHGLGGIALGALAVWIHAYHMSDAMRLKIRRPVFVLALVVVIGLLWEYFEYFIGFSKFQTANSYFTDTIMDMAMDVAGGLTALLLFKNIR